MAFDPAVGDIGFEIIAHFRTCDCNGVIIDLPLLGTDTIVICLRKPDQTTILEKVGTITVPPCGVGDGTDGKASYITVGGDLDVAGTWCVSGKITRIGGEVFRADDVNLLVRTPICP